MMRRDGYRLVQSGLRSNFRQVFEDSSDSGVASEKGADYEYETAFLNNI